MSAHHQPRTKDTLVNNKCLWKTSEQKFLIENYESLGTEKISLLLNRSYKSIAQRVSDLRASGDMPQPVRRTVRRRQFKRICINKQVRY